MNTILRRTVCAAIVLSAVASHIPAHAGGIPVIDVASIANQITQITHMVNQLQEMRSQLDQARQQYKAITGTRGMQNLLAGQARGYLPAEWNEAMTLLKSAAKPSYSALADAVKKIKEAQGVLNQKEVDRLSPQMKALLDQARNASASQQALGQASYKTASERVNLLQQLVTSIGSATDQKAIEDLQARIQAEQSMLQNEQIKLQTVAQLSQAQEVATRQMKAEIRAQTSGGGDFPAINTSVRKNAF